MSKNFISISDLCERYEIQRTACYSWRKKVGFPAPITPKHCHPRWRCEDIEQWENHNSVYN